MPQAVIKIKGIPVAKKRPRFARRGNHVVTYDDQETDAGRFLVGLRAVWRREPITEPVRLHLSFFLPRPKGHYGTGKNSAKLKPSAPAEHTTRPDVDNLAKFVKDCCNGEVWKDDSQVHELYAGKMYGTTPQTIIRVYW